MPVKVSGSGWLGKRQTGLSPQCDVWWWSVTSLQCDMWQWGHQGHQCVHWPAPCDQQYQHYQTNVLSSFMMRTCEMVAVVNMWIFSIPAPAATSVRKILISGSHPSLRAEVLLRAWQCWEVTSPAQAPADSSPGVISSQEPPRTRLRGRGKIWQ